MPILEMKGISKRFPHVIANDRIDFDLNKGEIHVILGENGAGKSTLINILSGIYSPDSGEIFIDGKKLRLNSPMGALSHGIGVVYQHFHLSQKHTAFENIILNHPEVGFFIGKKCLKARISELMKKIDIHVDLDSHIWQMPVSEQQKVEILKVLFHGACILVLDEPTAVLSPIEAGRLHTLILKMKSENHSVVMITHKLDEVMEIGDRVTILKAGRKVATLDVNSTSREELTRLMINAGLESPPEKMPFSPAESVFLDVKNLDVLNDRGLPAVRGMSFQVRRGEIFGIAGVSGQGQTELAEAIYGLKEFSGTVSVDGQDYQERRPADSIREKIAYIPADRLKTGVAKDLSIEDNLVFKTPLPVRFKVLLDYRKMDEFSDRLIHRYHIDGSGEVKASNLSGGNIQKVILAREISTAPDMVIAAYPMRGLDLASCKFVRTELLALKEKGAAILLISEEIDEILDLADTVGVMLGGSLNGYSDTSLVNAEWIGKRMAEPS